MSEENTTKRKAPSRPCVECAEPVHPRAKTCKKCGAAQPSGPTKAPKSRATKKVGKKATKKTIKKSVKADASIRIQDPTKLKPKVYQSRYSGGDKTKVLKTMAANVRKSIDVVSERSKKRPVKLLDPSMIRRMLTPSRHLYVQYMLDSVGYRTPSAIEIVSPEGIGSTTWAWDMIGELADLGCYSVYIECEGKMISDTRMKRLLDSNPRVAVLKMNGVLISEARSLDQFDEVLRQTVKDVRKRCDENPETKGNPIFVFADPWGSLMSKGEAKGNTDWGLAANAKKLAPKETTAGSNFEHAKHAQGMARWLPSFMESYNCSVVFMNKQNDKVDMTSSMPSYMTPSELKNDTRIGGRALKRLCAYRITMLKLGDLREKSGMKRTYGHHIRMMIYKNSYGPRDRTCEFTVYFENHKDTSDYQSPGLSYADRTAAWFVSRNLLGTTVERDLYTCDALGCVAVPAEEWYQALQSHPLHMEFVGSQLRIEGYGSGVEDPASAVDIGETEEDKDALTLEEPPVIPE